MNNSVKFNVYRLKFKEMLRRGRGVRLMLLMAAMVFAVLPAQGQNNYVFMYNGNFLGSNTTTATTSFVPNASIYSGNSGEKFVNANGYYIRYNNGLAFTNRNNQASNLTIDANNGYLYINSNGNKYLNYYSNNNTWYMDGDAQYVVYPVTTSLEYIVTDFQISGDGVLTSISTNSYNHTNAQVGSCTKYEFGGLTYYSTNSAAAASNTIPTLSYTNITTGYTWHLEGGGTYATVNESTGQITVSSLPINDLTVILTCSVTSNGITKTATKEITIQGTKPSAPIISVSGSTVTLSTNATGSTTIRYTLDGSNPTATTGTVYSGAIDLSSSTNSPVTIKAVTVRNDNVSDLTTEVVTLTLPEPTITVNVSAGTATISATTGATIYYTTNGSTPSATNGTQYTTGLTGLSMMTTIKAIAVKDGWNDSPVASEMVTISSNVTGGTVTLFDYEDHTWTYYSGVDASVDGGNYNTNYAGKLYSPNPRNVKITYNGVNGISGSSTTVKVSVETGETQNQFVYYKTLEEGSTSGEYPYQVISNPFSVRPSVTNGNTKTYYGFAGWKIVSGYQYIRRADGNMAAENAVLGLDEQITFVNLPYPSVNCTSAEIVFQTTWTQANVQTGNNIATMLSQFSGGTYETNFAVLTGTYTPNSNWAGNKNATITSVYPDGSTDSRSEVYTYLNRLTLNDGYTIKFEYIHINNNSSTFSMGTGTKTLYIGRGVSNTTAGGVVCNLIQGFGGNNNITGGLTYTLKIESGVYNYISFVRGYSGTGNTSTYTVTGTVSIKSVLGCDYDRANEDNSQMKVQNYAIMGYTNSGTQVLVSPAAGDEVLNVTMKSGSLNSNTTSAGTADVAQSFYIGIGGDYSPGARVFTMEGGEMWSLAAGICKNSATTNSVRFRIKGGLIKGSIYGSAANANSYGYKQMILTGGQVKGWIAGGGNGTSANGGVTTGSSYVYVGGNCRVDSEGNNTSINSSVGGQVFGSGSGVPNTTTWGEMLYGTNVVIADNAYVERNVFGGGNYGWTDQNANIYLTGSNMSVGNVYGGANQNKGDYVKIYMTGGTVREGLYGGSNTSGNIGYDVTMQINGGQVGTPSADGVIHGGGLGNATRVLGSVNMTLGASTTATDFVTVYGDVYGGSAQGKTNGNNSLTSGAVTNVTLNKGDIHGSLYGGGLGNATYAADVYGPVTVTVNGGKADNVFGCNNTKGAPQSTVSVTINGTDAVESGNAVGRVFGGGNQAAYSGTPDVNMNGGIVGTIYGGGNEAGVGGGDVAMTGGTVKQGIYGGCNTSGTVTGAIAVNVTGGTVGTDATHMANIHGGGYGSGTATGGNVEVNIGSINGSGNTSGNAVIYGDVYGGSALGSVNGTSANTTYHTYVTLNAGTINGSLYGGGLGDNNTAANVYSPVRVTVNGGSVNDPDGPLPSGTNPGSVFGCNNVNGSPQSTVDVIVNKTNATVVNGNTKTYAINGVYGGGNQAHYDYDNASYPTVTINGCTTSIKDVYGGGNAAAVPSTHVTINGGDIDRVFGGGNGESGTPAHIGYKNTTENSTTNPYTANGNVTLDINGGTINQIFGGSNAHGTIKGSIAMDITKSGSCEMHIGEVYGGGNEAAGNAGTITIGCTGGSTEGIGDLYGGANAANVNNNISLSITGGSIERVFGGNNQSGSISGTIQVEVNWTTGDGACSYNHLGSVYGGGNQAAYRPTTPGAYPAVNIKNGTVSGNVFGGGLGATAKVCSNPVVTVGDITSGHESYVATVTGNVYGGGSAAMVGDDVQATASTNNTTVLIQKSNSSVAKVFGGGMAAGVTGTTSVTISGGTVSAGLYGGCDDQGTVVGNITVNVLANVGTDANHTIDVFGGGLGAATNTEGNVTVTIGNEGGSITPVIYGDIYGGSALGNVNNEATDLTKIDFLNGTLHGTIFGGGLGDANNAAKVNGEVQVNISNNSQTVDNCHIDLRGASIYGCNNTNGSPQADVTVNIYKTGFTTGDYASQTGTLYAIDQVFGGGKNANYQPENGAANSSKKATVYIHDCVNTVRRIFSGGDAAAATGVACTIEGGRFDYVFGGGNGEITAANIGNGGTNLLVEAGIIGHLFGGSNERGTISGAMRTTVNGDGIQSGCAETITEFFGGGNLAPISTDITTTLDCGIGNIGSVYGGSNKADITGAVTLNIKGGTYTYAYGGSKGVAADPANSITGTAANITGAVTLNLYGGTITNAFGGSDQNGNITGQITVNVLDFENATCPLDVTNIYGGGNVTPYTPSSATLASPAVNVMHIKQTDGVKGDVFGGGLGETAVATSRPVVTIGYDATTMSSLKPTGYTEPSGFPRAKVTGNVYGGGSLAAVTGNTSVLVQNANTNVVSNVFGGGSQAGVSGTTTVQIANGTVTAGVYGGCNTSGTVGSNVTVSVTGGTIGTAGTTNGAVYGGGLGADTKIKGNVSVTIDGGTINNDVYGGSAKGLVNCNDAGNGATSGSKTDVTLDAGTINGSLYGGGHGIDNANAHVWGPVQVTVNGGTVTGSVYGCNNANGAPQSTVKVDIYGTDTPSSGYALANVFGGGNLAGYVGTPEVTIHNCNNSIGFVYGGGNAAPVSGTNVKVYGGNTIGYVFGGGNGTGVAANFVMVTGNVLANIYGGTIGKVFGGNNSSGLINGTVTLNVNKATESGHNSCDMKIGEVYGGGNLAAGNAGSITIGCTGTLTTQASYPTQIGTTLEGIGAVYGGANQADIGTSSSSSNITLTINSGIVGNVFGGNNTSGNIYGTIEVNIEKTSESNTCGWYVGNVFGGGNLAQYTGAPAVNVLNGTVSGNVYGGGKGLASDNTKGQVTGNPVVTIGDATKLNDNTVQAIVSGDVYGGGDAGNVVGTPVVNVINKCNTTIANVYGGGNAADVSGTDVNIDGGNITGMVFGGGHGDKNSNPQKEANVNGNVAVDVTGGTINKVFGGSNSKGAISGSVAVNINKGANSCEMHITEVYGGGNEAAGNAGTITIECTGDYENNGEGITTVYGGANAANVGNSINLTIKGGHIDNVYGGNNTSGSISGTVTVNVNWDDALTCGKYLGNVFGGGNLAALSGAATVNIQKGTVSQNVYGGGNQAGVGSATVSMTGGSVLGGLYGGCNTSGTVGGAISVSLTGGTIGTSSNRADVFGGGLGSSTVTSGNIGVTLNGTTVYGDLYGGSALGQVNGSTSHTTTIDLNTATLHGTIYGGGKGDNSNTAISNGNVLINYNTANTSLTGFYGGANVNGNVKGAINVNVLANVGASNSRVDVFGGGLGAATQTEGNVTVTIGDQAGTSTLAIYGDVYGGSSLGSVNNQATDKTTVNILSGSITGNVYGGGMGEAGPANVAKGQVNGEIVVNIGKKDGNNYYGSASFNTYTVSTETRGGSVYGCNNTNGSPKADVTVNVYQTAHTSTDAASYHETGATYAIDQVFGGGNLADYSPASGKKTTVNVVGCSNTVRRVFGGGNAAAALGVVTVIDGGRFDYIFGGGNGEVSAANIGAGGVSLTVSAGRINHLFGGSNTQGTITGSSSVNVNSDNVGTGCEEYVDEFFGGGNLADISGNLSTTIACGTQFGAVYGGCNLADITGNVTLTVNGGTMNYVYGGSKGRAADNTVTPAITAKAADISGNVTLNLYGGTITNAFGGSNINGNIGGNITVNVIDAEVSPCELDITNIYGAGNLTDYTPDNSSISYPQVNIKHIKSGNSIHGNVYGGGKQAAVTANPVVNIGNGTAGQLATISGKVFGGGDEAGITGTTTVNMLTGSVGLGLYGGCNTSGTVTGAIAVNVTGGTVGTDATHTANVHGGGYGQSTGTGNNVEVTIGSSGAGTGPTIYGDVYGGSALGNVNGTSTNTTYHTYVTLNKGTINGNLYGGGLGQTSPSAIAAMVYSPVQVTVNSGKVTGAVYGCNNSNGAPQSTVNVDIYGTDQPATGYAIGKVFGGGNQAAYGSTPVVKVHNCDNKIEYVYGGGNAATVQGTDVTIYGGNTIGNVYGGCYGADVTTNGTDVKIYGGTIGKVFGGNNSSGTVTGNINVNVNKQTEAGHSACEMHITEVYGGGNLAASEAGNVEIGCTGGATEGIDYVYGGANQANVTGDITLSITGGRINNVFGGNNTSGSISGDITVDVVWDGSCAQNYLGNVYGAGNLAPYTMHSAGPTVNIKNGTAANVYGGGKGSSAIVTGNPVVTIGDNVAGHCAIVSTNVYGGGDAAAVTGNTSVTYNDNHASSTVGKLFGGGNAASVSGTSTVMLTSGNVTGGVYGGCNSSGSVGAVTVALNGGTVGASGSGNEANVYGGGFGPSTTTSDNIDVTLNGTTVYGDLYGGSALGSVNAANKTTTVTISSNTLHGTIYGGGQGSNEGTGTTATTLGNVIINYNTENTNLVGLYGGANVNGNVAGNINVKIEDNVGASGNGNRRDIYGGGLGQNTTTDGNVTVTVGNSSTPVIYGDIYGGSALGEVGASGKLAKVDFKAGTLNGTLYGGGMGQGSPAISATVTGGTEVDVTAGTVTGGIYGGCNERGTVVENITVNVNGGTIGANGTPASVFGGGYGNNTATQGDVTVNVNGATVWGDVYGGSGFGNVNNASTDATTVNILAGEVKGHVFGGGLGATSPNYAAAVNGVVTVNIGSGTPDASATGGATGVSGSATIGGNVYGCNNTNGSPQQNVTVNIYQTAHITGTNTVADAGYAIANVFGGGKNADFSVTGKTATVNVYSCDNTIGRVFGGGDAAAVTGSVVVIQGGRFNYVFGGGNGEVVNTQADIGAGGITLTLHGGNIGTLVSASNQRGTVSGPINVTVDNASGCDEEVTDFFGGSNMVNIGTNETPVNITNTIECGAGIFHNVYGGSNAANIIGDVVLNIKGGTMTNVFGGSKGVQNGTAANITGNVTLNLYGGTIGDAFGGSNYNGNITGNITVNVLDHEGDCKLDVTNIYGSGNLTPYTPTNGSATSPTINVMHIKVAEAVDDDPATTDVDESRPAIPGIRGSVYGAGRGSTAIVTANPRVNIGYDAATMANLATVQYPSTIDRDNYTAVICGNLIGGGDAAAVTGSPVVTVNNGSSMVKERIIGGGNAANVTGNTHVVINDGVFGTGNGASRGVYGGCNTTGTVSVNSQVDVLGGTFGTQADINNRVPYNIYGGGFGENTLVSGNVTVNYGVDNGTTSTASEYPKLYGDIYGGSALGDVNTNGSNTTTVNVLNGSFGHFDDMVGGEIVDGQRVGGYLVQYGGNIYGGGLGQKHADAIPAHGEPGDDDYTPAVPEVLLVEAMVNGVVTVNIGAGPENAPTGLATLAMCNVYGCNNAAGSPQENVYVNVYQTAHTTKNTAIYDPRVDDEVTEIFAIRNVYGGGNEADFAPAVNPASKSVNTHIYTCLNTVENIYGGGNAADVTATNIHVEGGRFNYIFAGGNGQIAAANVLGHAEMTIRSGHVGWHFEGCNMQGTVGSVHVVAGHAENQPTWPCGELVVDNYYFGANMATVFGGKVSEVNCGDQFEYRNVYAGSRLATIYGNIQLTVRGGKIGNLYGGSEGSDYISANVKKYPASWEDIDNFPAEDQAGLREYFANHAHDDEYGTGGNITLILEGGDIENVFGGCNFRGNVEGDIHITVDSVGACPLDIDYIYGGSRLAAYSPDGTSTTTRVSPLVELKRGHVNYDVFGGSRGGAANHAWGNGVVYSSPKVIVGDGVAGHTFRIGHIDRTDPAHPVTYGDLYGGGSAGDVHGNVEVIIKGTVDGQGRPSTDIKHDVFGGGKSGDVFGNTKVTIIPQP